MLSEHLFKCNTQLVTKDISSSDNRISAVMSHVRERKMANLPAANCYVQLCNVCYVDCKIFLN